MLDDRLGSWLIGQLAICDWLGSWLIGQLAAYL